MTWTQFMDMHSGGGCKEPPYEYIYIEAPLNEAVIIFQNRFGHNPYRVSCTCCGDDYSPTESATLEQATAYNRRLRYAEDARGWLYGDKRPSDYRDGLYLEPGEPLPEGMKVRERYGELGEGVTLEEYLTVPRKSTLLGGPILLIRADAIKPEERIGSLRDQGYVWVE